MRSALLAQRSKETRVTPSLLTVGEGREGMVYGGDSIPPAALDQSTHQQVHLGLDEGLQLLNILRREELGNGRPPHPVQVMVHCREGRILDTAGPDQVPAPLVALSVDASRDVEGVVELGLADVKLTWVDPHDGAVLGVHVLHDPDVVAAMDDIVVELVPTETMK
jgi:hypothetical protein